MKTLSDLVGIDTRNIGYVMKTLSDLVGIVTS